MVTSLLNNESSHIITEGACYKYDQLNRIRTMSSYSNLNINTNKWENNGTENYVSFYKYDKNGNLNWLLRYGNI